MAEIIIDITELEQGTIGNSGNDTSSTRVRSPGYFTLPESADEIKVSIISEAVNGKTVYTNIMGYGSSGNLVNDYGWKSSGTAVTLSQEVTSFRICLRYSDSSSIYPSDIQSCSAAIVYAPITWFIGENGFPTNTEFIDIPEKAMGKPYPLAMWRIEPGMNDGFPFNKLMPLEEPSGAFMNAHNLEYAYIPRSCKKIGEWAFTNTKLRRVKIAEDCEYFPTSFPPDCEIEFYGGGGEYGQLFDSEGYALLDANGARIYVKE